ncbi:S-adenosylmethionine mitochondrial carrier protein-like isoform X3 [Uloborus diversus]|uniref:S-adenosylmethionine mitochondrial carrier protein-like isoform X3 n=1 Tax=Uloborus diversus TaxID=327109 RepID=UPI0024096738|nr:S-adenosylmethionine mitochondrial carrier protein-like isoform X3 [Uloborus diversus]
MADIHENNPSFTISLMSGAAAGLAVDLSLFPLDTMKTRLQSEHGFWKSGGFRNMYSGIGSVVVGSAPGAAVFFCTYETIKSLCHYSMFSHTQSLVHMFAASCGEVGYRGLYRGYFCTLFREIPFSLIQFPIWEYLKNVWSSHQGFRVRPWQSSLCGAVAGSIAASITTPLDVAKTRIMLANKGALAAEGDIFPVIKEIYREEGFKSLFSGMLPRVLWISIGGAIFFGAYEKSKVTLVTYL